MQLLDQALVNLYRRKEISRESLYAFCNEPEQVEKLIIGSDLSATAAAQTSVVAD